MSDGQVDPDRVEALWAEMNAGPEPDELPSEILDRHLAEAAADFDQENPLPEPLDHISRRPLPWREADLTECGRKLNDVVQWVTRDVIKARIAKLGKQRTAFTVCMTCVSAMNRWEWHNSYRPRTDLVDALRRECEGQDVERLQAELRALGILVAAHREEFDELLTGLAETIDLQSRRRRAR